MSKQAVEQDIETSLNGSNVPIEEKLRNVCKKIAPVWPLESFITVNPYHGILENNFMEVAEHLRRVAGARTTMHVDYYLEKIDDGLIEEKDLKVALEEYRPNSNTDPENFIETLRDQDHQETYNPVVPSVADIARTVSDRDWSEIMKEQVSDWAATYFDKGQTMWPYSMAEMTLFSAWKEEATIDRTPEVLGLSGFRSFIRTLPDDPIEAATKSLSRIDVPDNGLDLYLERLLYRVGGWSAYARKFGFESELEEDEDSTLLEFLSVQLSWEVALLDSLEEPNFEESWNDAKKSISNLGQSGKIHPQIEKEVILQTAYDHADRENLRSKFPASQNSTTTTEEPILQSAFCIDVRSEIFRRHLEDAGSGVQTFGFPGFFGFPIEFYPLAHEEGRKQCPPLLTADYQIDEAIHDRHQHEDAQEERRLQHHIRRTWKAFKWGAVSCFMFVGPIGMAYLPKLFTDMFGLTRTVPHPDHEGLDEQNASALKPSLNGEVETIHEGIPESDRVDLAEDTLRALSLTDNFAPLILLAGHGSTMVNNPYGSGYDCGACGGNAGSANAYVAASVLNDEAVRKKLQDRGIKIPEDTFFLAGKHDTTKDEVEILNQDEVPDQHTDKLKRIEGWLQKAGEKTRKERSERFYLSGPNNSVDSKVLKRSRDWSQVRPEWGLAGCNSFVVAPRSHTENVNLEGRSFLHNYEWEKDENFEVLELIMTAPMVVTSWINLQYYASTVDNDVFGSGNKTLHNVVGKMGIFEGNGGDLRVGLPWQSIHDGDDYQHKPARLKVVIEAPHDAMNSIIESHETVHYLCENGWIQLYSMDESGGISHQYVSDGNWESL